MRALLMMGILFSNFASADCNCYKGFANGITQYDNKSCSIGGMVFENSNNPDIVGGRQTYSVEFESGVKLSVSCSNYGETTATTTTFAENRVCTKYVVECYPRSGGGAYQIKSE